MGGSPDHRYPCVMNHIYGSPSYLHDLQLQACYLIIAKS